MDYQAEHCKPSHLWGGRQGGGGWRQTRTRTATIVTTIAAMMEGGRDCTYDEDECGDRIVGTDQRGAVVARGDDTNCPFSKLCLHPRLVLAPTSPAGPFKLERLTAIQSCCIAALLP
jgi:hypothetical protein